MFTISCNLIEYQSDEEKAREQSRMSSTSSPEFERIKITWVSGSSAVLRMPVKKGRGHFPLERKTQSYEHLPLGAVA